MSLPIAPYTFLQRASHAAQTGTGGPGGLSMLEYKMLQESWGRIQLGDVGKAVTRVLGCNTHKLLLDALTEGLSYAQYARRAGGG